MFSIEQLNVIRAAEIAEIAPHIPRRARVLEIGAGTGQQALELQRRGFDVTAIEVSNSAYASARVFPVIDYDGAHIRFPERSFDVVFSSNALEHVRDLAGLHTEIRRVLKPDGVAIHVLPTHTWRFWSTIASSVSALIYLGAALRRMLPASDDPRSVGRAWYEAVRASGVALLQPRHGERGFGLAELWLFHPRWWRKNFRRNGFALLYDKPMGLFYTGSMVFGPRISLERRARLAKILGSSCHLFVMRPAETSQS
ncbi:MAG TPA: class I SAM-dependent methyltransferase [Stellaceae bacterium]|nr:class I SAM-dependent methyltransferase [Stellaceae bacterium]